MRGSGNIRFAHVSFQQLQRDNPKELEACKHVSRKIWTSFLLESAILVSVSVVCVGHASRQNAKEVAFVPARRVDRINSLIRDDLVVVIDSF
jgi:hypothetical protein